MRRVSTLLLVLSVVCALATSQAATANGPSTLTLAPGRTRWRRRIKGYNYRTDFPFHTPRRPTLACSQDERSYTGIWLTAHLFGSSPPQTLTSCFYFSLLAFLWFRNVTPGPCLTYPWQGMPVKLFHQRHTLALPESWLLWLFPDATLLHRPRAVIARSKDCLVFADTGAGFDTFLLTWRLPGLKFALGVQVHALAWNMTIWILNSHTRSNSIQCPKAVVSAMYSKLPDLHFPIPLVQISPRFALPVNDFRNHSLKSLMVTSHLTWFLSFIIAQFCPRYSGHLTVLD